MAHGVKNNVGIIKQPAMLSYGAVAFMMACLPLLRRQNEIISVLA